MNGELLDGSGVYGGVLHYALVISLVGSAFLIFFYLWRKGRLDIDEDPKYQMMRTEERENLTEEKNENEVVMYSGDPTLLQANGPVPNWLKWTYITLPIWGIITFFLYWNGSWGWLDRGYWKQLQQAANTTVPYIDRDNTKKLK